jgi:5'-deoxynucleotidase
MRFVRRWGLMRNTYDENLQEHSLQVAMIAHALAVIRNRMFEGAVNPERAAALALFHDAEEVLTGDVVAPIKHSSSKIRRAHREVGDVARQKLYAMLPAAIRRDFRPLLFEEKGDRHEWQIVHAADKLCAYLKCVEEVRVGNEDFAQAAAVLKQQVESIQLPEVGYFLKTFAPSFAMTLDELNPSDPRPRRPELPSR